MRKRATKRTGRRVVPASEFKARCLRLLDEVGEGQELVITKHGKPIARLTPIGADRGTSYGRWKGLIRIAGDIVHTDWSQDFDASRR